MLAIYGVIFCPYCFCIEVPHFCELFRRIPCRVCSTNEVAFCTSFFCSHLYEEYIHSACRASMESIPIIEIRTAIFTRRFILVGKGYSKVVKICPEKIFITYK